jgi:POT family proton-dependent oligopeptide transporter
MQVLLGIMLCGYIGEKFLELGLAGVFMLFGMLQFYFTQDIFGDIGLKPTAASKQSQSCCREYSCKCSSG